MTDPKEMRVHIDGASRGNPGPAAYGVVMESADGSPVAALSKFLGETTNNVAEYQALLGALEYALAHGHRRLRVLADSELLARQIAGRYKVKSPDLRPLYEQAQRLIARLEAFSIEHVPRERNRQADRLANQALDAAEAAERLPRASSRSAGISSEAWRATATYRAGRLELRESLPLSEGEQVEIEIRRKR
jgi:ribonuclease HI